MVGDEKLGNIYGRHPTVRDLIPRSALDANSHRLSPRGRRAMTVQPSTPHAPREAALALRAVQVLGGPSKLLVRRHARR